MMNIPPKTHPLELIHAVTGGTDIQFAEQIGIGLRSLYRHRSEGTLPRNKAAKRNIEALAAKHNIELHPA